VARVIRSLRPQVVLGHDPWKPYRLHPDHRHAGWLTVDGCVAARDPHFFPEHGLAHHRPDALLLFEAESPDVVVDVTGWAAAKVAALLEHRSQHESTMYVDDDPSTFADQVAAGLRRHGALADVEHGEAFRLLAL